MERYYIWLLLCLTVLQSYHQDYSSQINWYRLVWSGSIPNRYRFITWLLGRRSSRRGMPISIDCVLCSNGIDSCQHLFFECLFSAAVWKTILSRYGISHAPRQWDSEFRWLRIACKGRNTRSCLIRKIFVTTVYFVWWERNCRVAGQNTSSQETVIANVVSNLKLISS